MSRRAKVAMLFIVFAAGCGARTPGPADEKGGAIPRLDLRAKSQNNLKQIGIAYGIALTTNPPRNLDDLKGNMEGADALLQSPVDQQPYEIVWGVDPSKLPTGSTATLLAWEKNGDKEGGRNVLLADCKTVLYLKDDEFQKMPRAKGSR